MAAASPPRRRPVAVPVAALAALAVLVTLAALALGRATPGGLQDHGATQPVAPPLVAQPLWPDLAASPPPRPPATGAGAATQAAPQPVPDVTVPGHDIKTVDVRTVLAKDSTVGPEERRALDSCPACDVRSPEFRDLTGDGREELVVAVATPGPVVLHVYLLADDRLLPILQVEVLKGFSAATVGSDLWLYEPTGAFVRTSSHYQWDGVRLGLLERKVEDTGPIAGPIAGPAGGATNGAAQTPTSTPSAGPAVAQRSGRPSAQPQPSLPEAGAGAGVSSPKTAVPVPVRPPSAPSEAKP
ncbi:hypothetical protein ACFVHI_34865 [Kitasatospora sp. NPDC127121]|uniref:hypothetical protein n=1 Tax=unclassified Kitasatospora TaxID=2633591 RepID=UPI00362C0463